MSFSGCAGRSKSAPAQHPATFRFHRGFAGVKAFLKILLIVVVALIAVKLLPLTLALGVGLGLAVVALAIAGVSIVAALMVAAIFLLALLSPLWVPVLLLVGLIALIKKLARNGNSSHPVAAA